MKHLLYRNAARFLPLLVAALALIAASLSFSHAPLVRAEEAPSAIKVLEQSTESRFRDRFIFRVRAASTAGNIIEAKVIFTTRSSEAAIAHRVPRFTPAPEVTLQYVWNTRLVTTPPWQFVHYRWELTDDAGNTYRSPRVTAEMSDATRDWQKLSSGKVAVYWYDRDEAFGRELLDVAQRGYAHVAQATGYVPENEMRVVMYNDQETFCVIFAPGECLDWFAGVTFGNITVQWIGNDERFVMRQVVPHELAHAFLQDWLGSRVNALPRWFDEGQATNNELEGLERELHIARALARTFKLDRLPVLDLERVLGRDSSLRMTYWYAQSASLVAFLYERWGLESLGEIVTLVRKGWRFDNALKEVTGLSLEEYEIAWRDWLGAVDMPPTLVPTPTITFPPTPTYEPTPIKR